MNTEKVNSVLIIGSTGKCW